MQNTSGIDEKETGRGGEEKFQRKGVFYGNIQDLSFAQDRDIAVIGWRNSALQMVENLQSIAGTIHLVMGE